VIARALGEKPCYCQTGPKYTKSDNSCINMGKPRDRVHFKSETFSKLLNQDKVAFFFYTRGGAHFFI
jgi:hypothetical protein